jgi:hypothetical protein
MSTTDGAVIGTTQIFGSAPQNRGFNVVLLAEGFTVAQQSNFDAACTAFKNQFIATAPFDELQPVINIFRVNVRSTDSGADDPAATGGTGASVRTYFDATFGAGGIRRLLVCNNSTALLTAAAQVPAFTVVLVVVNSTVYGGSGGSVGTFSLAGGANEIAIHEMGHTAFGLADEYAYWAGGNETGRDRHPAGEPSEPNVTLNTNRATLKWGWGRGGRNGAAHDEQSKLQPGGFPCKHCGRRHCRSVRRGPLLPLRCLPPRVRLQDAQPGGALLSGLPPGDLEPTGSARHSSGSDENSTSGDRPRPRAS